MDTQNIYSGEPESHLDDIVNAPELVTKNIRFVNYIIDVIVVYGCMFLFGVILALTGNTDLLNDNVIMDRLIGMLVFFLYYFFMESASGRTIGKLITKTKVVAIDGTKPTTKQILLRSLSRVVPFDALSFLGNNDGWHDRWTDTMVIKKK